MNSESVRHFESINKKKGMAFAFMTQDISVQRHVGNLRNCVPFVRDFAITRFSVNSYSYDTCPENFRK